VTSAFKVEPIFSSVKKSIYIYISHLY